MFVSLPIVFVSLYLYLVHLPLSMADLPPGTDFCVERWRCAFEHVNTTTGVTWRWDLSTLCKNNGTYTYEGSMSTYQQFNFNICGNTSSVCSDYVNTNPMYESHGVATQFFQIQRGVRNNAATSCLREDNVTACPDWTFQGTNTCCSTRRCEVVALPSFTFDVKDIGNPATGGVVLIHTGYPASDNDEERCPDDAPGLVRLRQFVLDLQCDPKGKIDDITIIKYDENNPYCIFRVTATTKAACGVPDTNTGTSNMNTNSNLVGPSGQVGFTILGALLVVGLQISYGIYSIRKQTGGSIVSIMQDKVNDTYASLTGRRNRGNSNEKVPLRLSAVSPSSPTTASYNSPNRFNSSPTATGVSAL